MKNMAIAQYKLDPNHLNELTSDERDAIQQHSGWTEDQNGTYYSPGILLPEVTSSSKPSPKLLELPLDKIKTPEMRERLRRKLLPVCRFQLALFDFSLLYSVLNGRLEMMDGTVLNGLSERLFVTVPHFNHVEQLKKMLYNPHHQVKGRILGVHYVHPDSPDLQDGIFTVVAKKYRSVGARSSEVREMVIVQHSFSREGQGVMYQAQVVAQYSAASQMLMNLDPFLSSRFLAASQVVVEDYPSPLYRLQAFAAEGSSIDADLLPVYSDLQQIESQVRSKLKYPKAQAAEEAPAVQEAEIPSCITEARYWVAELSPNDSQTVQKSAVRLKELLEQHERKQGQPVKNRVRHQQELEKLQLQLESQLTSHRALFEGEPLGPTETPELPQQTLVMEVTSPQVVAESLPSRVATLPHAEPQSPLDQIHQALAIDQDILDALLHYLNEGQNVILVGPPGCGKTRLATLLAEVRCGKRRSFARTAHELETEYRCYQTWHCTKECSKHQACFPLTNNFTMVTADPRWTSTNLVGGLRVVPGQGLHYQYEDGIVTRAVKAHNQSESETHAPHDLIIDELNRANMDEAFGRLFTVLDDAYRGNVPISSREDNGQADVFMSPTFRIIGTMNDQDSRALHQVGNALRRRFVMVQLGIPRHERQWMAGQGFDAEQLQKLYAFTGDHTHWQSRLTPTEVRLRSFYPLGTSFLMDVLNITRSGTVTLDRAISDKVVVQLEHLHEQHIRQLMDLALQQDLKVTAGRLGGML